MINVGNVAMKYEELKLKFPEGGMERKILEKMADSEDVRRYSSMEELSFELEMRKRIIDASVALYRGGLRFSIFRESECNENYWERMGNGGFRLKSGIRASDGIRDMFRNGRKYSTECATAIVAVFYKAVLDIFKDKLFDSTFPQIILMNWMHTDDKLEVYTDRNPDMLLPGDCRYFKNPDVDPMTPEWQGENAIDLGDGTFYGHGLGIRSAETIIRILNRKRLPGSETSAYLMNSTTLPDFEELFSIYSPATGTIQAFRQDILRARRHHS